MSVKLPQCLTALEFGFGVDQVGHTLGLRQIELAGEKSPTGELTWLGGPQPQRAERLDQSARDRDAAMHLKLGAIFTRVALRPREKQNEAIVDCLTARRVHQARKLRMPRGRQLTGKAQNGAARRRSADPANRNRGAAGRRRHRKNRVVLHRLSGASLGRVSF
jgi:hypothetical protein